MLVNVALAVSVLPLLADAAPLRASRRTSLVKRLTWAIAESYSGSTFFNGWTFYVGSDAAFTHGEVDYVQSSSLAYFDSAANATIMRVDDTTNLASGAYRDSTRISSNAVVNENSLVIADFSHVPYGCATWPAFWLVGPSWPSGGEIDIFEGVNLNAANQMTVHTSPGCTHDTSQAETGTALDTDCNTAVNGNAGCGVEETKADSYGDAFNNNGGGVWATQWDSDGISIWFWPRGSVPSDVESSPEPTSWGTPSAFWSFDTGDCSTSYFNNMQAVFDITLCGDWAGNSAVYADTCSGSCSTEVETGSNFQDAYFQVNYVRFWTGS